MVDGSVASGVEASGSRSQITLFTALRQLRPRLLSDYYIPYRKITEEKYFMYNLVSGIILHVVVI